MPSKRAGRDPSRARTLRVAITALRDDHLLQGPTFSQAYVDVLDQTFADFLDHSAHAPRHALIALGSYARDELCPYSDIDVVLVAGPGARGTSDLADECWYPFWDAGLALGHKVGTVKDLLRLANDDIDTLTALLDGRLVAGDVSIANDLRERVRHLTHRRRDLLVTALAQGCRHRAASALIPEMLDPDLKSGGGGLRDVHALRWAGWAVDDHGGIDALAHLGYLADDDRERINHAHRVLLETRIALHRVAGYETDLLALQYQDDVATELNDAGIATEDADELARRVAQAGRDVAWLVADVFDRLTSRPRGLRAAARERPLAAGVVMRDGRVALSTATDPVPAELMLTAALAAATRGLTFDRATLSHLRSTVAPTWTNAERDLFLALLDSGPGLVGVVTALDYVGAWERILPEWVDVRARTQRNSYHRYTVDRHLLEAVVVAAGFQTASSPYVEIVRRLAHPSWLGCAALLHDLTKGQPGDHATTGARTARRVAVRLGLDDAAPTLAWLVQNHLLLADTASRRDLSDPDVIETFVEQVGAADRLRLLYLLTVADAQATGPAAWNATRAALMRELFDRAEWWIEHGAPDIDSTEARLQELRDRIGENEANTFIDAMPRAYRSEFSADSMMMHAALVEQRSLATVWEQLDDDRVRVTIAVPDRPALLSLLAGCLTISGFDIHTASLSSHRGGSVVDVFTGHDRFGRFRSELGRTRVEDTMRRALAGEIDVSEELARYRTQYQTRRHERPGPIEVRVDADAAGHGTHIEVLADDEIGLLARVAATFGALGINVVSAKAQTLGRRVVDSFTVREATGAKLTDPDRVERLRATLLARLTAEFGRPE